MTYILKYFFRVKFTFHIVICFIRLYYRFTFVLVLQVMDPDHFAGALAVDHVEVVIQMLLILKVFNSATIIA